MSYLIVFCLRCYFHPWIVNWC